MTSARPWDESWSTPAARTDPSSVTAWLDARAESEASLESLVSKIIASAEAAADQEGTSLSVRAESTTGAVNSIPHSGIAWPGCS